MWRFIFNFSNFCIINNSSYETTNSNILFSTSAIFVLSVVLVTNLLSVTLFSLVFYFFSIFCFTALYWFMWIKRDALEFYLLNHLLLSLDCFILSTEQYHWEQHHSIFPNPQKQFWVYQYLKFYLSFLINKTTWKYKQFINI